MSRLHDLDDMFPADIDDAVRARDASALRRRAVSGYDGRARAEAPIVAAMVHAVHAQTSLDPGEEATYTVGARVRVPRRQGRRLHRNRSHLDERSSRRRRSASSCAIRRRACCRVRGLAPPRTSTVCRHDDGTPRADHDLERTARCQRPLGGTGLGHRRPELDDGRTLPRVGVQHPVGHRARARRDASADRNGRKRGTSRRTTVRPVRARRFRGTADD